MSDIRELIGLVSNILSLLANSLQDPVISRVPELVAMVASCPVVSKCFSRRHTCFFKISSLKEYA